MNILIISQVFWPENFKINELCTDLVNRGHKVTVITGKPNYPQGKFYKGYGLFSKIKSIYNGVVVYRLPIIPRRNATGFMLALNYLSFAFCGSLFSLFHFRKYDFSLVFAVSPITSALPAILHRAVFGTRLYLWILDLWPEGVEVTGKLKSKYLLKKLYSLVRFIYGKSDRIYISSRYMERSIQEKFTSPKANLIRYMPNWAEDDFGTENVDINKYSYLMPKGFKIMFAGNIGSGQDIPSIIKAAQIFKEYGNIKIIILGDGSEKGYLVEKIEELKLHNTIYYLGSYPIAEMSNFYCHADMMLLTLRDELIYSYTVPGKLQGYLASKKPIAAMINGEAADIIKRSKCGIVVNAEDYLAFTEEILKISKGPELYLNDMKKNGFSYYEKTFAKEIVINSFLKGN
jgi:glycosyltransferase involved in cell wall biosynthesis